jgi:hypothetical protein
MLQQEVELSCKGYYLVPPSCKSTSQAAGILADECSGVLHSRLSPSFRRAHYEMLTSTQSTVLQVELRR